MLNKKSFLLLLLLAHAVFGIELQIEALKNDAKLIRSGKSLPLKVGDKVLPGDTVSCGIGARVYISLPDGSRVKLGEKAKFQINSVESKSALFKATFSLLEGAFRFTTNTLAKDKIKRELQVKIKTATIGIRGTDIWGRSDFNDSFVVLIEGNVSVEDGATKTVLSKSLQTYQIESRSIKEINTLRLLELAKETEIE